MGAAELTIAELQKLIHDTVLQSKAVSDAGVRNSERIDELCTTVDNLFESTTKAISDLTNSTETATKRVETTLDRIITSHNKLNKTAHELKLSMEMVVRRADVLELGQSPSTILAQPHQRPSALWPHGHRAEPHHQSAASGEIRTSEHALVGGEQSQSRDHLTSAMYGSVDNPQDRATAYHFPRSMSGPRLPKSEFPSFDGDNPKWWKAQCEKYFKMYQVQDHLWVDFSTMHFRGNAALWLQTFQAMHTVDSWAALCVAVFAKFNRNKYDKTIDTFFAFKQTASVDEYAHKFEEFMHTVLLYNPSYDETFFVHRFLEGLKPQIRQAIKLQQPRTVDLAFSLAQTQEALLVEDVISPIKQIDHWGGFQEKFQHPYQHQGILGVAPDHKSTESAPSFTEKFDTLRPQRKARGECFKCGEKFGPGHKCPKHVQLNVIEELFEALHLSENLLSSKHDQDSDTSADSDDAKPMHKKFRHTLA